MASVSYMLKILSPFMFLLLLYSGNNITKPSYFDGMLPTDTSCIKEMQKAKEDLMYQKLVYCHYDGMLSHNTSRQDDILDSLFYKYGIIVKYESIGCFVEEDKKTALLLRIHEHYYSTKTWGKVC